MSSKSPLVCGLVLAIGLIALLSPYRHHPTSLPQDAQSLIKRADTIQLFSLDPYTRDNLADRSKFDEHEISATKFHGYIIYGSHEYTDDSSKNQIRKAIMDSTPAIEIAPASCFWPRHGLRFTAGSEYLDLLICFECNSMNTYSAAGDGSVPVTSGGKAVLSWMLMAEGIRIEPGG